MAFNAASPRHSLSLSLYTVLPATAIAFQPSILISFQAIHSPLLPYTKRCAMQCSEMERDVEPGFCHKKSFLWMNLRV